MAGCLAVALSGVLTIGVASAAPADGTGPWADGVVATAQGKTSSRVAVPAIRSDATSALGAAEQTKADGTFYTLGIGGSITVHFDNQICSGAGPDLAVYETTRGKHRPESARLSVSADGSNWIDVTPDLGQNDQQVNLPDDLVGIHYVRVRDTTSLATNRRGTDGYDIDGVKALQPAAACTTPTDPTGGGGDPTGGGDTPTGGGGTPTGGGGTPTGGGDTPAATPTATPTGTDSPAKTPTDTKTPAPTKTPDTSGVLGGDSSGNGVIDLSDKSCLSKRKFYIRLRVPKGFKVRTISVKVAGKKVPVSTSKGRFRAPVDLRGLVKGTFKISVVMRGPRHTVARDNRTYHTCHKRVTK